MDLADLQDVIERTFGDRDRARGVPASVAWLAEEVGELAQAVRKGSHDQQVHEFGDVIAWVATLANQMGVDLTEAVQRYAQGCPAAPQRLALVRDALADYGRPCL